VKHIVLCADDYGLSPGVSRGIRELLEQGRLSATSCMVVYPEFSVDGPLLKPFLASADIGLHFTMTQKRSLPFVAAESFLHPPSLSSMIGAVEEQVGKFNDALGRLPDYIDGHQHVHLLPVLRDAVVHAASGIGAYVRDAFEPIGAAMWWRPAPLESAYLSCMSRPLSKLARCTNVATNRGFRGARNFRDTRPFRDLFRSMIAGAGDGCLVMCHPGYADPLLAERDAVREAREAELRYFAGPDFPRDLDDHDLALCRLADSTAPRAA
jgi:predicted glycoside hydrolase/deacetylase ChbG (UPF0249 family)